MDRFAPALRRVARDLDLPRSARSAILGEMAADLEAVYAHHRARGADEAEAMRRAEETILGGAEVMQRLGRLHRGTWRAWSANLGARLSGGGDLVVLATGVVPVLALAGVAAAKSLPTSGPLAWAVGALGAALVALIVAEAARLASGAPARMGRLSALLVLSALAPTIGALALTLGLFSAARAMAQGAGGPPVRLVLAAHVAGDGATLLLGLLFGIAGMLAWFILLSRSAAQTARDVDTLLEEAAGGVPSAAGKGAEAATAHEGRGPGEGGTGRPGRTNDIVPLRRGRST